MRFLPPLLIFVLILGAAPAVGQLRDLIFDALPGSGPKAVLAFLGLVGAGIFFWTVRRIHKGPAALRRRRYGGLVAAGVLVWLQGVGFSTELATVNAAEKVHLLEYGLLAFFFYRAFFRGEDNDGAEVNPAGLAVAFCTVALCGTVEEGVQWLAPQRTGDVRDVGINALAGLTGLVVALSLLPPRRWTWRPSDQRLAPALATVVLAAGLFFGVAHLGHEIHDEEVGSFVSRFTAEELLELSAERRRSWAVDPPRGLPVYAVEDTYLTEAGWHVRHRNTAIDERWLPDVRATNRILEKYFAPYLDLDGFMGNGRQRLPPAQRARFMRAPLDPDTWRSPVLRGRVVPWPKGPYYLALGVAVLAVFLLGRRFSAE